MGTLKDNSKRTKLTRTIGYIQLPDFNKQTVTAKNGF